MARPADELIPTRATLLERLKNWRDDSSWQDFFDSYWKLIYRVALKAGLSEVEAEDVVQETMMTVAKHMPSFQYEKKIGSFKSWLLNMIYWRVKDEYRKRLPLSFRPLPFEDADAEGRPMADSASLNWEELWDSEWKANLLDVAIARVKRRHDPEKFQIFDFHVNKGWPPGKVAKAFGISVGQVYVAKHRILAGIKEEVQRLQREANLPPNEDRG